MKKRLEYLYFAFIIGAVERGDNWALSQVAGVFEVVEDLWVTGGLIHRRQNLIGVFPRVACIVHRLSPSRPRGSGAVICVQSNDVHGRRARVLTRLVSSWI